MCGGLVHPRLQDHNLRLQSLLRIIEIQAAEALFGRLFQIFHQALIARIVGDDQLKIGMRLDQFALLVQRQRAPVIGQRMDDHRGVLARFDNFVQITDGTQPSRRRQRSVLPLGAVFIQQKASHQIGSSHILVAGDGNQRTLQFPGHILDKTGLATAGRPLEHHRHACVISSLVQGYLIAYRSVERLPFDSELLDIHCRHFLPSRLSIGCNR